MFIWQIQIITTLYLSFQGFYIGVYLSVSWLQGSFIKVDLLYTLYFVHSTDTNYEHYILMFKVHIYRSIFVYELAARFINKSLIYDTFCIFFTMTDKNYYHIISYKQLLATKFFNKSLTFVIISFFTWNLIINSAIHNWYFLCYFQMQF